MAYYVRWYDLVKDVSGAWVTRQVDGPFPCLDVDRVAATAMTGLLNGFYVNVERLPDFKIGCCDFKKGLVMRVNVYAEEITTEATIVDKGEHHGVRLVLKSHEDLHHTQEDDDRSAITFWGLHRTRALLANMLRKCDEAIVLLENRKRSNEAQE